MFNRPYLTISVLLVALFFYHQSTAGKKFPGYMAVRETPVQRDISGLESFAFKDFTIHPFAEFEIKALVLSKQGYSWGKGSELVPVDLALGWGPMSNGQVLKDIKISQDSRWYRYAPRQSYYPIPEPEIIAGSANMHLIPSTPEIRKKIKNVRKGDIVVFSGYLVNVTAADGWNWRSSSSRTDTNDGSCELVWVREFKVLGE